MSFDLFYCLLSDSVVQLLLVGFNFSSHLLVSVRSLWTWFGSYCVVRQVGVRRRRLVLCHRAQALVALRDRRGRTEGAQ